VGRQGNLQLSNEVKTNSELKTANNDAIGFDAPRRDDGLFGMAGDLTLSRSTTIFTLVAPIPDASTHVFDDSKAPMTEKLVTNLGVGVGVRF
jgi:hypothetical protein